MSPLTDNIVASISDSKSDLDLSVCFIDWNDLNINKKTVIKLTGHKSKIKCIEFSPILSNIVLSGDKLGIMMMWDIINQTRIVE